VLCLSRLGSDHNKLLTLQGKCRFSNASVAFAGHFGAPFLRTVQTLQWLPGSCQELIGTLYRERDLARSTPTQLTSKSIFPLKMARKHDNKVTLRSTHFRSGGYRGATPNTTRPTAARLVILLVVGMMTSSVSATPAAGAMRSLYESLVLQHPRLRRRRAARAGR